MTDCFFWRLGALAGAIVLLGALAGKPAHALGLGRITVQSALGEALRAEIDVPEITFEEAASLRVGVASADAFKAAGLEYTAAVVGVQVSLQRRPDGRSFLRLSSSRPVTEPFVDLILEASWGSGRVVRDYTMLFDPPNLRQAAAQAVPNAPVLSGPAVPPAAGTANPPTYPSTSPPAQVAVKPASIASAQPQPAAPKAILAASAPISSSQKVTVKSGDTAGGIAAKNKPASVSLDQMLVALLKSNPDAFIGGNINRLKSGAVLDIPAADEAGTMSASQASNTIIAQARDFNDFRQRLASGIPTVQADNATRQAGGKVQANVEDRAAITTTPDKLTLSKGVVQGKAAEEDRIAKEKQAKDASSRVAELTKNIGDLSKITGTSQAVPAAAPVSAMPASAVKPPVVPGVQVAVGPLITPIAASPLIAATTTAAVSATSVAALTTTSATSTPTAVVLPAAVASASVLSAPAVNASAAIKKPADTLPPPPPKSNLIDELTSNPMVLPGLGVLLALLAGFGFYRYKKRNEEASVDSSFLDSRLQSDSLFRASGGQRIDTSKGSDAAGSSLVYSYSQLDTAGDADPVAEADVYLAYGRDLQAEEILKEALRTNPTRVAIHAKLLEIYAKRRDLKGFEVIAADVLKLTQGNGPEWAYICKLGRDLDPANPMYQSGSQPPSERAASGHTPDISAPSAGAATVSQTIQPKHESDAASVDFDLALDFSAPDESLQVAAIKPIAKSDIARPLEPTAAMQDKQVSDFDGLDMGFDSEPAVAINLPDAQELHKTSDNSLSFDLDPVLLPPVASKVAPAPAPAPAAASYIGMLEFDMGSLSLDLDAPTTANPTLAKITAASAPAVIEGPLETKFALAEEFRALGDSDGARSLANEVVAQADGALKSKAQAFLNALS